MRRSTRLSDRGSQGVEDEAPTPPAERVRKSVKAKERADVQPAGVHITRLPKEVLEAIVLLSLPQELVARQRFRLCVLSCLCRAFATIVKDIDANGLVLKDYRSANLVQHIIQDAARADMIERLAINMYALLPRLNQNACHSELALATLQRLKNVKELVMYHKESRETRDIPFNTVKMFDSIRDFAFVGNVTTLAVDLSKGFAVDSNWRAATACFVQMPQLQHLEILGSCICEAYADSYLAQPVSLLARPFTLRTLVVVSGSNRFIMELLDWLLAPKTGVQRGTAVDWSREWPAKLAMPIDGISSLEVHRLGPFWSQISYPSGPSASVQLPRSSRLLSLKAAQFTLQPDGAAAEWLRKMPELQHLELGSVDIWHGYAFGVSYAQRRHQSVNALIALVPRLPPKLQTLRLASETEVWTDEKKLELEMACGARDIKVEWT